MTRAEGTERQKEKGREHQWGTWSSSAEQDRGGGRWRAILWAHLGCSRRVQAEKSDTVTAVLQEGLCPQAKSSPPKTYLILLHFTNAAFLNKPRSLWQPPSRTLSAPFSNQHLLASCFCVKFW